jgi:hypothetical protein
MDWLKEVSMDDSAKICPVLGETSEPGKPQNKEDGRWRQKMPARTDNLKYLQTGERYWYSKEWQKRKTENPA